MSSDEFSYITDDDKQCANQEIKTPPLKKKKIGQKYRAEWEKQFIWITPVKGSAYTNTG